MLYFIYVRVVGERIRKVSKRTVLKVFRIFVPLSPGNFRNTKMLRFQKIVKITITDPFNPRRRVIVSTSGVSRIFFFGRGYKKCNIQFFLNFVCFYYNQ
jgi:hypothetical protein